MNSDHELLVLLTKEWWYEYENWNNHVEGEQDKGGPSEASMHAPNVKFIFVIFMILHNAVHPNASQNKGNHLDDCVDILEDLEITFREHFEKGRA